MPHKRIAAIDDLAEVTRVCGILPFFSNAVNGWSVEEMIDPAVWFTDREGPWEWKGHLASGCHCVYGKFIRGKAAFVSLECFAHLANWRRKGMSFDDRMAEGMIPYQDEKVMRYFERHPNALSKYAKKECGITKGYDASLTRLQMSTDLLMCDFRYSLSKGGQPYGWGNAAIDLPERWLGEEALALPDDISPEESFEWLLGRIMRCMPQADEGILRRELK